MQQANSITGQHGVFVVPQVQKRLKFSVLISVYKNDDPQYFDEALQSVTTDQTLSPDEVILVVDGPVGEQLTKVIARWENHGKYKVKVIRSPVNLGLSRSLNLGLDQCSHPYVARMDSDDVSLPRRFEQQIGYLEKRPDIALLGGWYQQFDRTLQRYLTDRQVPRHMAQLVSYSRTRTPFNHVTAVFKRETVLGVGGYPNIDGYSEDWWVALRLIKEGHVLENLPDYLVKVRGDEEFLGRRGGWTYIKQEFCNLKEMRQQGLISTFDLVINMAIRTPVRLLPLRFRAWIYKAIRKV